MREALIATALVLLWSPLAQAETDGAAYSERTSETQSAPTDSGLAESRQSSPASVLPNLKRKGFTPVDGPAPCPSGTGVPCALLGGRRYFPDPFHMTEHDATWAQAMKNPFLIAGEVLNLAATIADIEGTQACLHAHTCTEGDPLFGRKPGRAEAYGIGIPLSFGLYAISGRLKKTGNGNIAFAVLWGGTLAHAYFARKSADLASGAPATTSKSGQSRQFGISIRF